MALLATSCRTLVRQPRIGLSVVTLLVAALLLSCGGGGGSTEVQQVGSAESNTPLRISAGNGQIAIQVPAVYAESLLALALDVENWKRALSVPPAQTAPQDCLMSGTRVIDWQDHNRNALLDTGDELRFTLTDCGAPASAIRLTGAIHLSVLSTTNPGVFAARVSMPSPGLSFRAGEVSIAWKGAFTMERTMSARRDLLVVRASNSDRLLIEFSAPATTAVDRVESADLSRDADADRHGTTTSLSLSLASDVLRGRVGLRTPTPLFAHFDTFPLDGVLEAFATGRVSVPASMGAARTWLTVVEGADAGSGFSIFWSDLVAGLAWVGPGPLPAQYATVRELSAVPFGYVDGTSAISVEPTSRLLDFQFNRELQTAPAMVAELRRVDPGTADVAWGPAVVRADVDIRGGRLRLSWNAQLEPGRSYDAFFLDAATLQPAYPRSRNGERPNTWPVERRITVVDSTSAVISVSGPPALLPGIPVQVDGSGSHASSGALATYRWTQLSGRPVQFSATDQSLVNLTLEAAQGVAPEDIRVQLEVVDARGVVDRRTITLRAVPSPATSGLAMMRGSAGDTLLGETYIFDAVSEYSDWRWQTGNPTDFARVPVYFRSHDRHLSLFVSLPLGVPLQPGRYHAPVRLAHRVDTAAIDVWFGDRMCEQPSGTFTIHEVELATQGANIDGVPFHRLALDFDVSCAGAPNIAGAVRLRSGVALPL